MKSNSGSDNSGLQIGSTQVDSEARWFESLLRHTGRVLLGFYFFGPGLLKVFDPGFYEGYMATHGVPFVTPLLWLTVVIQVVGGLLLMIGYRPRPIAFLLAGLTLVINVFMHDFWNSYEGLVPEHEQQNFVKNLGIMAGLLYIAGTPTGLSRRKAAAAG